MGAAMRGQAFKIRQVFSELRHALGKQIPAIELLQLAAKLVEATCAPSARDDEKIVSLRRSINELPLDEAFADGGWRIMTRDRAYNFDQFEDDPSLSARAKSTLDRLMKRAA
jgi:hypothetical protein